MALRTLSKAATALIAPALALGATVGLAAAPASAAVWSSCDQWGSTTLNGYTLYNDIWGSGAGTQCIWANSGTNWGVNANHPNTGGIKSYPNANKVINKSVSTLASLTSSYNVTVPSSGAYETAYDIWDTNHKYEIMLWVNKTGAVGPLGTSQGSVTLGGSTWTAYKGNNGSNDVFSFVRSSNSSSGSVNILPILKWIKDTKGWFGDVTIGDLQFGFEITSSAGGLNFTVNSESVSSS
ncbi:hypothetical protein ABZX95_11495 [Streptomyces sp. NPDC004232]|uniref:glycoside hydrolase family 12 protein n=1 Tax=Streptomyces sp. NPDC004232 TaxID=3154454 RepID=UPI001D3A1EBB|nr:hypothetical protein [Streptomyces sp. tea 10]